MPRPPTKQTEGNEQDESDSPGENNDDEDKTFGLSDDENDASVNFKKEKNARQTELLSKLEQLKADGTPEQVLVELGAIVRNNPNELKTLLTERPEVVGLVHELKSRWTQNS